MAIPATPADAKGLLAAAIRDPDPVVVFEPRRADVQFIPDRGAERPPPGEERTMTALLLLIPCALLLGVSAAAGAVAVLFVWRVAK